ncbi:methylmalonyl-CoA carboxyltransferase [Halomonas daqingensis]|uniref:Methylmalonyl-CoA carboxyltransferase n=1 Tax=Billgrantia desiderata TaxID=52021 RepID=A0ABS9B477_9GAMM|nr:carboxyl transferase domain-containing protein [Halomonas desiderata]MCE8042355.1 methylmalonyl-CoA carboxyltransferase [Halomonas desiderata]MCE8046930.1 methylmalonyl-CoA carboxyltransferase [Halomonas desiderata]
MSLEEKLAELKEREERAYSMGGEEKLQSRRKANVLNARERIDYFVDPGSFMESGLLGVSAVVEEDRERTPGDGKLVGFAQVNGRPVGVASNDFTVKGASSSLTNMKKIGHVKRVATERGFPLVFFGESSGARMPDNMGSRGMGTLLGNDPKQYVRHRESPWASAVLGQCYGSSAWYACLSDFTVMRKGSVLAVASASLASAAIGQKVDPEDLGGWKLHDEVTGLIDRVVETDEEALDLIRRFLSYLPSHRNEPPPRASVPVGSDEAAEKVEAILPDSRRRGYDVRKIITAMVDQDSFFELKPRFGRAAVTGLARLDGRTVGIVANNPMYKAGAMDVAGCEKITHFLVLCDSFNIPIVMMVDTPGFVIGIEGERMKAPGKIMNFMTALQMCTVPKLSVIMRKSYGQAYLNMGGGRNSDEVIAWPTAEVSFMDPAYSVQVVTWGRKTSEQQQEQLREQMELDNSVWGLAEMYAVQTVIRPADTRQHLIKTLEFHTMHLSGGVGKHQLAAWPTTF